MRRSSAFVLLVASMLALAPALDAGVVKYVQRSNDVLFPNSSFPDTAFNLPLNDAGATSITFQGGSGQKLVAITFSAECAAGGGLSDWVNITILVDDEAVPPSDDDDAFCSGNGSATQNDGWVTASRTVAVKLGPGQHTVRVFVSLAGAPSGWIGDSSLTIIR